MDILHLVDRLEQLLANSRRIPMTASLIVDEDRAFNLIDQMRVSIPEEVKKASRVVAEKERVLAQAKEEGDRIRDLARAEAEELVKRDAIVQTAQQRAERIQEQALRDAEGMRHDSDVYVMNVLSKLEDDLLRSLSVVRNGLRKLQADHGVQPTAVESPDPSGD
ncbi:MAG: ATPase [Chloroflexi bacterium]|nr:ATPase [Chloroflexota bacterium]MDA0241926.1 ATP synthase F0 subunit B [Chloroflexota bacterium]